MRKSIKESKKILFKVGHHLINLDDISSISAVRKDLYIIKMKSNPEPEYPIWCNTAEVAPLLKQFKIENADGTDKYQRGEDKLPNAFNHIDRLMDEVDFTN